MKYIRTKDGIYKSKRNPIEKDCLVIGEKENGKLGLIVKDIIKKADTIDELCDEFVVVDKEDNCHHLTLKTELYDTIDYEIYGAIWTEWGLKYVAKMNDKGELELL